jgi:hypothetical protein
MLILRKSGGGELIGGLRADREVFFTGRAAGLWNTVSNTKYWYNR